MIINDTKIERMGKGKNITSYAGQRACKC